MGRTVKDNIRNIHGAALARELLELEEESRVPSVKVTFIYMCV